MLNKPRKLAIVSVDMEKFTPNDCLGKLFISKDNIMTRPADLEDLLKSNMWFGSKPIDIYMFGESTYSSQNKTRIIDRLNAGDWYMWVNNKQICQADGNIEEMRILWNHLGKGDIKKIIASTNLTLNLPTFTDEFIIFFMENYRTGNKIESVNVNYGFSQKSIGLYTERLYSPKVDKENNVNILPQMPQKQNYTRDEVVKLFESFTAKIRDLAFDKITLVNLTPDAFIKQNLI